MVRVQLSAHGKGSNRAPNHLAENPLLWHARRPYQHVKRGWFGEFGPDVFGLVLAGSTMLGLGQHAKTLENRCRKGRCLLNLPLLEIATAVDRLALSTGKLEMPDYKVRLGFRYA